MQILQIEVHFNLPDFVEFNKYLWACISLYFAICYRGLVSIRQSKHQVLTFLRK